MKKLLLSSSAITFLASAVYAGDLADMSPIIGGSIEVEVKENDAGDFAATSTLNVGMASVGVAYGYASVESVDGNTFEIDEWQLGTQVGSVGVSFGNQGDLFVSSWSDYSNVFDSAMAESLAVNAGAASVALGFTDITSDVTDINIIQGAYTLALGTTLLTASAEYDFDAEEWAVGTRSEGLELAGINLGSTMSYASATETFAYELDGGIWGLTTYVNGDQNDMLQNIGAGYTLDYSSMAITTDINYNIDAEEFSPRVAVALSF